MQAHFSANWKMSTIEANKNATVLFPEKTALFAVLCSIYWENEDILKDEEAFFTTFQWIFEPCDGRMKK